MGQKVLIIGKSGTGKSTSMRNFAKDEVCLIKSINKQLPFRGKFDETHVSDNVQQMIAKMRATNKKVIVIDDAQYVMGNEFFRRANEQSWQKFTDIGKNFYDLLTETDSLPEDVIVYFLLHTETDSDGNIKVKTIGKMLDEKLTVEGTATIVLMTNVVDGKYTFQTQNSGHDICKSPMGMFQNYLIDNDLKMVDGIIREYYELSDVKVEEKGVSENKPTRGTRRSNRQENPAPAPKEVVEEAAKESLNQNAGVEDYKPTNDTIPPTDVDEVEKLPKRGQRNKDVNEISDVEAVKPVDDTRGMVVPQQLETPEVKPRRRTLAEKLADSGVAVEKPEESTGRRRRRQD